MLEWVALLVLMVALFASTIASHRAELQAERRVFNLMHKAWEDELRRTDDRHMLEVERLQNSFLAQQALLHPARTIPRQEDPEERMAAYVDQAAGAISTETIARGVKALQDEYRANGLGHLDEEEARLQVLAMFQGRAPVAEGEG